MNVSELKPGDLLEDTRRGVRLRIKKIAPCVVCTCGWGEISYDELHQYGTEVIVKKCCKTFAQFARFKFLRRVEAG